MDWVEFSRAPEAPDPGEQDAAEHAQDGSITLTSGMLAHRPGKGTTMATAVAGAVEHLARGLAIDLTPRAGQHCMSGPHPH